MRVGRGLAGGGLATIVLVLLAMLFGVDPSALIDTGGGYDSAGDGGPVSSSPEDEQTKEFVSTVLGFTEDTWNDIFARSGEDYREPRLVLFSGAVQSACGFAQAAMGPFYCPADERVYLDMSFLQDLHNRFQAPGDFAQAYVIAHEVGHHVQNLLGISGQVDALQRHAGPEQANEASVRLELQADCFAGVCHTERLQQRSSLGGFLETGDVEEALRAASSVGDDRLQMRSQGYVVPESFTHGSAEQRARWFHQGLRQGSVNACNTFEVANP
jgi:predicted metalloprotease